MKRKLSFRLFPRFAAPALTTLLATTALCFLMFGLYRLGFVIGDRTVLQQQQQPTTSLFVEDIATEPALIPVEIEIPEPRAHLTKELYQPGYLISPGSASACPDLALLLVAVITAPGNRAARDGIRASWGKAAKKRKDAGIVFMVGKSEEFQQALTEEAEQFQDMVVNNMVDSYENLTLKSLSALDWQQRHCKHTKYILKVDDDVFIQLDRLLQLLNGLERSPLLNLNSKKTAGIILGNVASGWSPVRNRNSKYFISENQYFGNKYPPFVTGPSYVIATRAVPVLLKQAWEEPYMHLEDVFITGIVAEKVNVPRRLVLEFKNNAERIPTKFLGCTLLRTISIHQVRPEEHLEMYMKAKKPQCGPPKG